MSQQWGPTNKIDIFPSLLHFVLMLNALVGKSSDLLEFNQTHNAATFYPSVKHLLCKYITPSFGPTFRVEC